MVDGRAEGLSDARPQARLTALSPRIALACIPTGNYVTEFAQQSGDTRAWVMALVT